jgi:hypothetical protein
MCSKAHVDDGLPQPRRGELLAREDPDRIHASIVSSIGTRRAQRAPVEVDEHHVLRLFDPTTLVTILGDTGYEVEVLDNYVSQGSHPALPGWYVVRARKV